MLTAIEIDGESHYGVEKRDEVRDKRLKQLGVTVLRFDDTELRYDVEKALKVIRCGLMRIRRNKVTHPLVQEKDSGFINVYSFPLEKILLV